MIEIGGTALSLLLCGVGGVFVGFIDSIAGGGGLVSLPMLLAMGLPPNLAIGTNKLAAACGNIVSSVQFIRAGKTKLSLAWRMIPLALAGSAAGSAFMIYLPEDVLRPLLLVVLAVTAAVVFFKRDIGRSGASEPAKVFSAKILAASFAIGAYDGFAGPGAGTFMVIVFAMVGFDFVVAAGNAKILAVGTNCTSLLLFIMWDQILYEYAVVLAAGLMIGAYFGSRTAIRCGAPFIRFVMMVVTIALIGKLLLEYGQAYLP